MTQRFVKFDVAAAQWIADKGWDWPRANKAFLERTYAAVLERGGYEITIADLEAAEASDGSD